MVLVLCGFGDLLGDLVIPASISQTSFDHIVHTVLIILLSLGSCEACD